MKNEHEIKAALERLLRGAIQPTRSPTLKELLTV